MSHCRSTERAGEAAIPRRRLHRSRARHASARALRPRWRELIKRIWGADPLVCPRCKSTMKRAGTLERPEEIEFFLRLHGLWEGLLDILAVTGHEHGRIGQGDALADAVVDDLHTALEPARADPDKSDPIPVGRVHIGLDFERKTGKAVLIWGHVARNGFPVARVGRHLHKGVQHLSDTEIIYSAAKKYRCLAPFQVLVHVKRIRGPLDEFHVFAQFICLTAQDLVQDWIRQVADDNAFLIGP